MASPVGNAHRLPQPSRRCYGLQTGKKRPSKLFQLTDQIVNRHTLSIVRIDKARLDPTVLADHECGRDREHPGLVALILWKYATDFGHVFLHLGANPDRKIERHCVTVIHVRQDWK